MKAGLLWPDNRTLNLFPVGSNKGSASFAFCFCSFHVQVAGNFVFLQLIIGKNVPAAEVNTRMIEKTTCIHAIHPRLESERVRDTSIGTRP
jgi:hypothetical protein